MLQRGRKGSASLVVPPIDGGPSRLEPPASLSEVERGIFEHLIGAVDRRHFRQSDAPLVHAYVRAIALEQQAAKLLAANPTDSKQLAVWEKSTRALVSLSARLRLCPQSRQHPRTTARMPPNDLPRPWT